MTLLPASTPALISALIPARIPALILSLRQASILMVTSILVMTSILVVTFLIVTAILIPNRVASMTRPRASGGPMRWPRCAGSRWPPAAFRTTEESARRWS